MPEIRQPSPAVPFVGPRRLVAGNQLGQLFVWDLPEKAPEFKPEPKGDRKAPNLWPTRRLDGHTNEITRLVVGIRNGALPGVSAHPSLANVVVVGGDDIIPMARLDDTTRVGNETGYSDEFDVNGPYFGALDTSHYFSDDPYGDLDPVQWATRRLYVPELAIGRLVESPEQILAQLDAYGAATRFTDDVRSKLRALNSHVAPGDVLVALPFGDYLRPSVRQPLSGSYSPLPQQSHEFRTYCSRLGTC